MKITSFVVIETVPARDWRYADGTRFNTTATSPDPSADPRLPVLRAAMACEARCAADHDR